MGERIDVVNVWTHPANELGATTKSEFNALRFTAEVPEGSLTAARLRLADAAEKLGFIPDAMGDFEEQFNDALAALRTARGA